MKSVIIALMILVLLLVLQIFFLHREILKLNGRLKRLDLDSNQLLEINLFDRAMNILTDTLNQQIMEQRAYRISITTREYELKEAILNISHDLRTPLTAIIGYLQLMKREQVSKEQAEYIQILLEKSLAMRNLTQSFFELSYFDSQTIKAELVRVDLSNLLIEELLNETVNFESRFIEPLLTVQEECFVYSDEKLLTRILQNLVMNVLQHGCEEMLVQLEKKEKTVLIISNKYKGRIVVDTQKIFQRYYVSDDGKTNRGNGLGLAIVELLCHKLDIVVTATADSDNFTIRLEIPTAD